MLTYSIAIRTLGTGGDKFRKELESIARQTIKPERILIYIADGYERPDFTIGREEYIWVRKGMVSQRILPYSEITSDCIMMLDDDVMLAPDSAELMLRAMEVHEADCVGVDTFKNHELKARLKIYAGITNLVFPHFDDRWAFKIHRNGSFSYINNPVENFYWSQSCAGPASLWRRDVYDRLSLHDELWLDELGFAYGDDMLEFHKLYRNGYKLGILFNSGIENLDGQTSSGCFRNSSHRIYIRTKASFIIWWRTCYEPRLDDWVERNLTVVSFGLKMIWTFLMIIIYALLSRQKDCISLFFDGLKDGWTYVGSERYKNLGKYVLTK